jgi:hypothetical protein
LNINFIWNLTMTHYESKPRRTWRNSHYESHYKRFKQYLYQICCNIHLTLDSSIKPSIWNKSSFIRNPNCMLYHKLRLYYWKEFAQIRRFWKYFWSRCDWNGSYTLYTYPLLNSIKRLNFILYDYPPFIKKTQGIYLFNLDVEHIVSRYMAKLVSSAKSRNERGLWVYTW